jgi:sphingomyelin phosphodiesterase
LYSEHKERLAALNKEDLVKVVMMSDLHMDWDYLPGADNSCGKPLCCRSDSGLAPTAERAAGKWGDFKCDLNTLTLDSMLSHIKNEVKPDLVMWAGDSVPHNIDTLDFNANVNIMKNITKEVSEGLDGIKIFPCIGNHDTYP